MKKEMQSIPLPFLLPESIRGLRGCTAAPFLPAEEVAAWELAKGRSARAARADGSEGTPKSPGGFPFLPSLWFALFPSRLLFGFR